MLHGHNISQHCDGRPIIEQVNIAIERGTITALIGPSGSGKTTLLKTLSLLEHPSEGTVTIDNEVFHFPTVMKNTGKPWPKVSVVFQQLFLWPHLTLRENILLPLRDANKTEEINSILHRLCISHVADRYPNQVSLGERQRAALIRAIVLKPNYLLLDEITSALDVEQVQSIANELIRIKQNGTGILIVTHLIEFARQISDLVAFLDKGKIIELGDTKILTNPEHERVASFLSVAKKEI